MVAQVDHFYVLREGKRVLRTMQGRVSRWRHETEKLDRQMKSQEGHFADGWAKGVAVQAWHRAARARDAYSPADKA